MFSTFEHDYLDLSMENKTPAGLNLKATELRLGLPGSESPERESNSSDSLLHPQGLNKSPFVSGAKRGFSVAIPGASRNWVFSESESDFGNASSDNGGGLFSPGGVSCGRMVSGSDMGLGTATPEESQPQSSKPKTEKKPQASGSNDRGVALVPKEQVVGWPPIRSFRKNTLASHPSKNANDGETKLGSDCLYVKVSMDGAPYLRKVDLKTYRSYMELSSALKKMFSSCFKIGHCGADGVPSKDGVSESRLMDLLHGSEYVLTYEDKDGDWMLVGDVPWEMFTDSCKKIRIMKSSEATGLAPRAMEKCRTHILCHTGNIAGTEILVSDVCWMLYLLFVQQDLLDCRQLMFHRSVRILFFPCINGSSRLQQLGVCMVICCLRFSVTLLYHRMN